MNPFNANDIVTASDDPTIAAHMAVAMGDCFAGGKARELYTAVERRTVSPSLCIFGFGRWGAASCALETRRTLTLNVVNGNLRQTVGQSNVQTGGEGEGGG